MRIAAIIFTGTLSAALPLGLMLRYRKKGGTWTAFLAGAGTFVLSALVLERIFHALVLASPLGGMIQDSLWLYGLYGSLAAGLFEETGRLITVRLFLKKQRTPGTALAYGAGHGGAEAVLLVGVTMLNNLLVLLLAGSGAVTDPAVLAAAETLAATPAGMFLWAALERVAAVALHVSNSVLVFAAAGQREKRWLYPAAVLLHAGANFLAVTLNAKAGTAAAELATVILTALAACFAGQIYRKLKKSAETS